MKTIDSSMNPRSLAKTIACLYTAWQCFIWGQPLAGLEDHKSFKPQYSENVFVFLERMFSSIRLTPKYGTDTKDVRDCCASLAAMNYRDETILAQQKIADMLSLSYSNRLGLCEYDLCKSSRPLTGNDTKLLQAAFKEALIATLRFVNHNTLKQCVEGNKRNESYAMLNLYMTISKAIETLRPLSDYQEESTRFVYANAKVTGNSILIAYDQCYKEIASTKLEKVLGGKELHLNDLTFASNASMLDQIDYNIEQLQMRMKREFEHGCCVNTAEDSIQLIKLLEAIRSEYFRRLLDWSPESIDEIVRSLNEPE